MHSECIREKFGKLSFRQVDVEKEDKSNLETMLQSKRYFTLT